MSNEDKIIQMLEQMQSETNKRFDKLESEIYLIKNDQNELHKKYDNIAKDISNEIIELTKYSGQKFSSISDEIKNVKYNLNNVESKIDSLCEDFHLVEQISAKNYADIIKIKNFK